LLDFGNARQLAQNGTTNTATIYKDTNPLVATSGDYVFFGSATATNFGYLPIQLACQASTALVLTCVLDGSPMLNLFERDGLTDVATVEIAASIGNLLMITLAPTV
jgi:hypothetical protein